MEPIPEGGGGGGVESSHILPKFKKESHLRPPPKLTNKIGYVCETAHLGIC